MKLFSRSSAFVVVIAVLSGGAMASSFAGQPVNILPEGNFENGKGGAPDGFVGGGYLGANRRNQADWVSDRDGKFIRIVASPAEQQREVTWVTKPPLPVAPTWRKVTVRFKVRTDKNFSVGAESWHDARVIVSWLGEAIEGENVLQQVPIKATKVPLDQWKQVSETLQVPKGALSMRIELGTWGATGTIEFDDLEVLAN